MLAESTITKTSVLQQQDHSRIPGDYSSGLRSNSTPQLTSGAGLGENSRDSKSWKREKKPTGNHEGPYQVMRNAKLMTKEMIPQYRLETSMLV
jgi:hypothetical protein